MWLESPYFFHVSHIAQESCSIFQGWEEVNRTNHKIPDMFQWPGLPGLPWRENQLSPLGELLEKFHSELPVGCDRENLKIVCSNHPAGEAGKSLFSECVGFSSHSGGRGTKQMHKPVLSLPIFPLVLVSCYLLFPFTLGQLWWIGGMGSFTV